MSLYKTNSKTIRHTFSSTRLNTKKLFSTTTAIIACHLVLLLTFQTTTAIPLQNNILNIDDDLDDVQSDWLEESNTLSNDAENAVASDINNELERSLNEIEEDEGLDSTGDRYKRLTMEFNGMQVSYPQYMRLVALQEKVIKLKTMISKLNAKYPPELLAELPQYQRLMKLYNSLAPLLPEASMTDLQPQRFDELLEEDGSVDDSENLGKRSSMSVDFMGMQVSYPQYLRLVALQAKVVKLDKLMRKMLKTRTLEELRKIPKWNTLVALHDALKKMLPQDYVSSHQTFADAKRTAEAKRQVGNALEDESEGGRLSKRAMGTVEFNGVQMSYPQYWKMMELQKKVMKLDKVMQMIAEKVNDPEVLEENPKWKQLMGLRQAMNELMPSKRIAKRSPTMDFNGVQVSLPQYQHLMALQRKVMKLDAAMKKISEKSNPEALKNNPKWKALVEMRKSLMQLIPNGAQNTSS